MKTLENDFIKFWIDDGILYSKLTKPVDVNLENIKTIIDLRHQISNNEKQYWCFYSNAIERFSGDARKYAEVYGWELLHGMAVITPSYLAVFIFNIFNKMNSSKVPFKAFKNKEEAVKWLNLLKEKQ